MDIRPIRTEADYKATLQEISTLMDFDPALGTPEGDRLDILVTLVQAYEAKHVPITPPDPVEAIKFRMDQSGLSVKDLEPIIGKRNRVYEILNHKRPLTLAMIRRLHQSLGIPADVLIAETVVGDRRRPIDRGRERVRGCARARARAAQQAKKNLRSLVRAEVVAVG